MTHKVSLYKLEAYSGDGVGVNGVCIPYHSS